MAATVQAQEATGSGPTLANAEGGAKFNREDTITGVTPVPIPTVTGTECSWLKCFALVVTGTSTTNISNRRVSLSATETAGLGLWWTGQANYTQAVTTAGGVETPGGQRPSNPGVIISNWTAATNPTLYPSAAISGTITNMTTSVAPGTHPVTSLTLANTGNNVGTNVHNSQWILLDGASANAEVLQITAATTGTTITTQATAKDHATTLTHIALGYTRALTTTGQWDNTSTVTSSAARNGDYAQMFCGVDSGFAGGAGNATALPNILLTYDEA